MNTDRTSDAPDRAAPAAPRGPKSHVSIDTSDLRRSLAFYRALLDAEPVVLEHDYARFTPAELGLVLGLNAAPSARAGTGALQHVGVLYPEPAGLAAARERLARAGFAVTGETDVQCCYARLDQFWATDPSGVRWELFLAHEERVARVPAAGRVGAGDAPQVACCAPGCCP